MPLLAIRNKVDADRLRAAAETPFEKDLVETLIAWRFKYQQIFELIEHAAKTALEDGKYGD